MNEMTTYRWSFSEDVLRYVEHEISAIGVWRQKLSDYGEERGIDLLAENKLAVSNLMWAGGFTGSDGRSYRESVADAEEAIRLAATMQAGCLIVYSGGRNGHTRKHANRLLREALEELVPIAADYEVTLAIESMHPRCAGPWTYLTDWEATINLLEEVDSPCLKLVLDTYHLGYDRELPSRVAEHVDRIAIVQLGDARQPPVGEQNRCRLGEGELPLQTILGALLDAGYQGDYDIELLGEDVEPTDYDELIDHSKQVFRSLIDSASRSTVAL